MLGNDQITLGLLFVAIFCFTGAIIVSFVAEDNLPCKELSLMDYNNITITVNRDTTQYIQDSADTVTVIAC